MLKKIVDRIREFIEDQPPLVTVKIVPHDPLFIPKFANREAVGADARAFIQDTAGLPHYIVIGPGEKRKISLGIRMEIPSAYEAQIRPRSGLSTKSELILLNSPGTIDPDYRGEVFVVYKNVSKSPVRIEHGDRIAQIVIAPRMRVRFVAEDETSLTKTERGSGGFGHTGIQ